MTIATNGHLVQLNRNTSNQWTQYDVTSNGPTGDATTITNPDTDYTLFGI